MQNRINQGRFNICTPVITFKLQFQVFQTKKAVLCVFNIQPTCCPRHYTPIWLIQVHWKQSPSSKDRHCSGDSKEDRWWCGSPWETESERGTSAWTEHLKSVISSSVSHWGFSREKDKVRRWTHRAKLQKSVPAWQDAIRLKLTCRCRLWSRWPQDAHWTRRRSWSAEALTENNQS